MRSAFGGRLFPEGDAWHWGGVTTILRDLRFEERLIRLARCAQQLRAHRETYFTDGQAPSRLRQQYGHQTKCLHLDCLELIHAKGQCYNHYMSDYKKRRRAMRPVYVARRELVSLLAEESHEHAE